MRREIKSPQRKMRMMGLRITSNALSEGSTMASLVVASSVYTITFTEAFSRAPLVVAMPRTATKILRVNTPTTTGCVINSFGVNGTSAADSDMEILVLGADVSDAI